MKSTYAMVLAALLSLDGMAHATDQSAFLSTLKQFGITTDYHTSKRACLCYSFASEANRIGKLVAYSPGSLIQYHYECVLPVFDAEGSFSGFNNCLIGGGSVTVISK